MSLKALCIDLALRWVSRDSADYSAYAHFGGRVGGGGGGCVRAGGREGRTCIIGVGLSL